MLADQRFPNPSGQARKRELRTRGRTARTAILAAALAGYVGPIAAASQIDALESHQAQKLYVDGKRGSDSNPGTRARPLATIRKAARIAAANNQKQIGTTLIIQPGVYRESILLAPTGLETVAPIIIQAAQPGSIVLSGAEVVTGWRTDPRNPNIFLHQDWPYAAEPCAIPAHWPKLPEIVLRRDMIFVNGSLLKQVLSLDQLRAGSFYVDRNSHSAYIWPPRGTAMNSATVEVAARPRLLRAEGVSNVVLKGLIFQDANSCIGHAAVSFRNCKNIRIDACQFLWNNYAGLKVTHSSDVMVRGSVADHNGGGGMDGAYLKRALYEDDEASYNNWRGAMGGFFVWDPAGGKFLLVHDGVFRRFKAVDNQAAGLWFDTDNIDITVDDAQLAGNLRLGIFLEANPGPIHIQNSRICDNTLEGPWRGGVLSSNSEQVALTGNVIANNGGSQIYIDGAPDGRPDRNWENGKKMNLFTQNWTIDHNVIVGHGPSQAGIETSLTEGAWKKFTETLTANQNRWFNPSRRDFFPLAGPRQAHWHQVGLSNVPVPGGTFTDLAGWQAATQQDKGSVFAPPSSDLGAACKPARGPAEASVE